MRITLIIYNLAAGGAQRIMSVMASYWAAQGWRVTLLTLDDNEAPFFSLHPAIVYRPLGIAGVSGSRWRGVWNNVYRVQRLRQAIINSQPQLVISFMDHTNVLALLATRGTNLPVIVSEHCDPYSFPMRQPWGLLRQLLYRRAAGVHALNRRALEYFPSAIQRHGRVLPNPVMPPAGEANEPGDTREEGQQTILAMGRLGPEKGFDLLLRAFAKVSPMYPNWLLEIWGDGPLRADLEDLRDQLGLEDVARLPGKTANPRARMERADLFVMSSRTEAFPTVLCEAMACGLPVISFDCPAGPREIIRDGVDGVLVPADDVDALASSMDRLIMNADERARLAARAPEVLTRFELTKVMTMWEAFIRDVMR